MFKKFFLKNSPGSPGHTAKSLINQFNRRNQMYMADKPSEIYVDILLDRMYIAQATGESIYTKINNLDKIENFLEDDISTFTFLVLFSESQEYRDSLSIDEKGNKYFNTITDIIYEVCKKESALCKLNLSEFKEKANQIRRFHIYNI